MMQPCLAQWFWSVRIRSWKYMAPRTLVTGSGSVKDSGDAQCASHKGRSESRTVMSVT